MLWILYDFYSEGESESVTKYKYVSKDNFPVDSFGSEGEKEQKGILMDMGLFTWHNIMVLYLYGWIISLSLGLLCLWCVVRCKLIMWHLFVDCLSEARVQISIYLVSCSVTFMCLVCPPRSHNPDLLRLTSSVHSLTNTYLFSLHLEASPYTNATLIS